MALGFLGEIGNDYIPLITEMLRDENVDVRIAATKALTAMSKSNEHNKAN